MLCAKCGKQLNAAVCASCGYDHATEEVLYLMGSDRRMMLPVSQAAKASDFEIENGVLKKYRGTAEYVMVPSGVHTIGQQAFDHNHHLKGIILPPGLREISYWAFWDCRNLKSVGLPVDFETIRVGAFENCFALELIYFPSTVEHIQSYAFHNCRSLSALDLSHCYLKTVGYNAFEGCTNLRSVSLRFERDSDQTYGIDNRAFAECRQLEDVTLRGGVDYIGHQSFADCKALRKVDLHCKPYVQFNAFEDSGGSFELHSPEGYREEFGDLHFGLTEDWMNEWNRRRGIAYGNGTMNIADYEFGENDRVVKYRGADSSIRFPYRTKSVASNVLGYRDDVYGVKLPYGTEEVEDMAFAAQKHLIFAELPNSVKRMGSRVFSQCYNLERAKLPEGLEELPEHTFEYCYNLPAVHLPDGIKRIGTRAFADCVNLSFVRLPEGLETIGDSAFVNCDELEEITIPDSVTDISWNAFRNCMKLNTVHASDAWKQTYPELLRRILTH